MTVTPHTSPVTPIEILQIAAVAAGPMPSHGSIDEWRQALTAAAGEIADLALSPRSPLLQGIADTESRRVVTCKLLGVQKNEKANRAVVKFLSDTPSTFSEDGSETARTDRLENPEAMRIAKALNEYGKQGKKVRLTIVNRDKEKSDNGKGFRTIIAVEPAE